MDHEGWRSDRAEEEFASSLSATLRKLADAEARRCGLSGYADDLAQEAFCQFWERRHRPSDEEMKTLVVRLAEIEKKRRQRAAARAREAQQAGRLPHDDGRRPKGVPTLCLNIQNLAKGTKYALRLRRAVYQAAAAVAQDRKVLNDAQFRLFIDAYMCGCVPAALADVLETTEEGVTQRLQRVVRNLEEQIIQTLKIVAPGDVWGSVSSSLPGAHAPPQSQRP